MPQAAPVRQAKAAVPVSVLTSKTIRILSPVDMPDHLPKLRIFPGDDIDSLISADRHPELNSIINQLAPGKASIDYVGLEPRRASRRARGTQIDIQLMASANEARVLDRATSVIAACGDFEPHIEA
jgi:hypothetical protein